MAELENEPATMTVDTSIDPSGTPVISLTGELDISNVSAIETQLDAVIAAHRTVLFDLSGLTFMDSSGIAMLLRAADRTDHVVLSRPSDTIRRVIRATGLTDVFEILDG